MLIYPCRLVLHDSLFYATREMGTLYETAQYLHNYALSYALFNDRLIHAPYAVLTQRPNYRADLEKLNAAGIYVTPARPLRWDYILVTWKMAQVSYYRKAARFGERGNFPENIGRAKELAPESEFAFFVLSKQPVTLPRWIRMGKWASKILVEMGEPLRYTEREGAFTCAVPLNPLDAQGPLLAFDLVSMPPVSLLVNLQTTGRYYELPGGTKIPAGLRYVLPAG